MQSLVTQIAIIVNGKQSMQTTHPIPNQPRRGVVCYGCSEQGHVIRDCHRKASNSERTNSDGQNRSLGGTNRGVNENSNPSLN